MERSEILGNTEYKKDRIMIQKQEYADLYQEMELLEEHGIHIMLDGTPVTAFRVVQAHMIKEEGTYMRDYVLDAKGHLQEIRFNNIR